MVFPFYKLRSKDSGTVLKPLIPVILNFRKTHKVTPKILSLVDTGADVTFCHVNIGYFLGVKLNRKPNIRFYTANNEEFLTYEELIRIYVGDRSVDCPVYFAEKLSYQVILGQKGFLEKFKLVVDYPHLKISLE